MTTHNLQGTNALKKIKELAEAIDFTMLCTNLDAKPFHAVPMSTKRVDADGAIWFLSGQDSHHNSHIRGNPSVQLLYSDPGSMRFLIVYGEATIRVDREILKELYGAADDAWFDGIDDPNVSAIRIVPIDAHYWDTKHNRMVAMLKMGVAAITGEQAEIAVHGDLDF
jgi:general stress protein 26